MPATTDDGYKIQINYWNSVLSGTLGSSSVGYSGGVTCIAYDTAVFDPANNHNYKFQLVIPGDPPVARADEIAWAEANPSEFPWYGRAEYYYADAAIQDHYPGGSTAGGPTGYPSIWLGCSWGDANSCTTDSAVPWYGVATGANPGIEDPNTNPRILPRQLKHITSLPSTWIIDYEAATGVRSDPYQVWDAAFDIWFDKTGDPNVGKGAYSGSPRGQNDGLEIMVWMDHNHSYVDASPNSEGYAQPSGWPREVVRINNVDYDVWTSRLNNPYYGYTDSTLIPAGASRSTCPTLAVNGGAGVVCGTEWNVVSFVARQRAKQMDLDAKVFTDYILGKNGGGACSLNPNALWCVISQNAGSRNANGVLACPGSSMGDQQADPAQNPIDCLSEEWVLTSVQAGFEPWVGGNTLATTGFKSYALVTSSAVQSGRTADDPAPATPVVYWGAPFEVVYNGCTTYDPVNNQASFNISLPDGSMWPADGSLQDMGTQQTDAQFTYTVPALYPLHGEAIIHFVSACGNVDVPLFIDPSGRILYSDGVTPAPNAKVTLSYSVGGGASGPFEAVPNHNAGLSSPIMQPNDNTLNPMPTDKYGSYGWNVVPGYYRVEADKENCGSVTSAVQEVISEPIMNLDLLLPCPPPPPPGNLNVTLSITNSWPSGGPNGTGGYCATLQGTNSTGAPLDWTAAFNLPESGTIYDFWNASYAQTGDTVSASGVDSNDILAPGASLQDVGFCVNRGPSSGPTGHTLAVSKSGTGGGTVTSAPAGISCGGDCTESYPAGTVVELSASPDAGSVFAGWSGACTGTGACIVTMDADRSVTAAFNDQALTTAVNVTTDWGTGYCAEVVVTNNGSVPVDWKVTFPIPGGSIYDFWNAIWSQSGSQATAEGVYWNNILAGWQSTHSVGFCANR
jgi:cellulase/cellobiase CelA1